MADDLYNLSNLSKSPNLSSSAKPDSSAEFIGFDVSKMPMGEAYRLLVHCVAPRPIAFVSTLSQTGEANLAPFSFFMGGGSNPPSVAFAPNLEKADKPKDTLVNIRETGEYTINVVSHKILTQMNQASYTYPHGVSEWEKTGLSKAPAAVVKPSRVAESLMAMECRLFEIVNHGNGVGSANYVIGEVVYFHVNKAILLKEQEKEQEKEQKQNKETRAPRIDPTLVDYVGRMGGQWYTRALPEAMFQLARPDKG